MRLTKIYTKIGDDGKTSLATGEKISKADILIEAYGTVDELNSFTGYLKEKLKLLNSPQCDALLQPLELIQNELFDVGGELSVPQSVINYDKQQVIHMDSIKRLENNMDTWNENLVPLKNFILPGGHELISLAHICRTVCRRAERHIVKAKESHPIRNEIQIYLNRLSDWFFVLSRIVAKYTNSQESLWIQVKNK